MCRFCSTGVEEALCFRDSLGRTACSVFIFLSSFFFIKQEVCVLKCLRVLGVSGSLVLSKMHDA